MVLGFLLPMPPPLRPGTNGPWTTQYFRATAQHAAWRYKRYGCYRCVGCSPITSRVGAGCGGMGCAATTAPLFVLARPGPPVRPIAHAGRCPVVCDTEGGAQVVALTHVPPHPRRWFSARTTGFLISGARRPRLGRYHHDERHLGMARMGYIAIGSERRSLEGATGLPTLVVFTATRTRYLGAYPAFSCRGLPATRPVLLSMRTTSGGRAWRNTHLP